MAASTQEAGHDAGKAVQVFTIDAMSAVGEDFDPAIRDQITGSVSMLQRHDIIMGAPHTLTIWLCILSMIRHLDTG